MAKKPIPTPEDLRKLLRYDPETGHLYWRERTPDMFDNIGNGAEANCATWNKRFSGTQAFTARAKNGYLNGRIWDKTFYTHRVIWAIVHGAWPEGDVDHINRDRADNRIANLRSVTRSVNLRNRGGVKGYGYVAHREQFRAYIEDTHLGWFKTKEEAIAARREAELRMWGNR